MNLQEIKAAIEQGKKVYWSNRGYEVIKDVFKDGTFQYLIAWNQGGRDENYIGLTWRDGVTLNGEEKDFFTV